VRRRILIRRASRRVTAAVTDDCSGDGVRNFGNLPGKDGDGVRNFGNPFHQRIRLPKFRTPSPSKSDGLDKCCHLHRHPARSGVHLIASQFESFIHPVTIMMALPLAVVGAMVALFLNHSSMSISSFIGIILLMGLVTKNGILLVDHAVVRVREGKTPIEAVLEAGPARLRPILMTSAAMVLGMLPTALASGAGSGQAGTTITSAVDTATVVLRGVKGTDTPTFYVGGGEAARSVPRLVRMEKQLRSCHVASGSENKGSVNR